MRSYLRSAVSAAACQNGKSIPGTPPTRSGIFWNCTMPSRVVYSMKCNNARHGLAPIWARRFRSTWCRYSWSGKMENDQKQKAIHKPLSKNMHESRIQRGLFVVLFSSFVDLICVVGRRFFATNIPKRNQIAKPVTYCDTLILVNTWSQKLKQMPFMRYLGVFSLKDCTLAKFILYRKAWSRHKWPPLTTNF